MASRKQTTTPPALQSAVSTTLAGCALPAIVHLGAAQEYCKAKDSNEDAGSMLLGTCKYLQMQASGAAIGEADRQAIVLQAAAIKGWRTEKLPHEKASPAQIRGNELNTVCLVYTRLPAAVASYKAHKQKAPWNDTLSMARELKNDATLTPEGAANKVMHKVAKDPVHSKRVASALADWYCAEPGKRAALVQAAVTLNLTINWEKAVERHEKKKAEKAGQPAPITTVATAPLQPAVSTDLMAQFAAFLALQGKK